MGFVISSPFLSVLLTTFVIGTESVLYFLVFSSKQLNSLSKSADSYFVIKQ